jgi:CysZ protein
MVWITDEFYKFFILTLLSPINCLLSEKVDNEVTGAKFDGGFVRVMKDIGRAIFLLFFTLMLNFLAMFIWYVLAWIFNFHVIDSIVYFVIGAFFVGFSFYDFSLERYGVGFFGAVQFTSNSDDRPSALPIYKAKDATLSALRDKPLTMYPIAQLQFRVI